MSLSVCRSSTAPIAGASSYCRTEVKQSKFTHVWTVENFSICPQNTGGYLSSTFSFGENQWCLELYPKGRDEDCQNNLSVFLKLSSNINNKRQVYAKFKISILDNERKQTNTHTSSRAWIFRPKAKGWGFLKFIKLDNENSHLLVGDQLTIFCEVSLISDTVSEFGQSSWRPIQVPECRLNEDLGQLLETASSGNYDVTLCVQDQEIRAHKLILTARSPVFKAMFDHDLTEKTKNRVEITDVDPEAMHEMVHFMYTDRSPNLDEMADRLLAAADKYALKRLKIMCEEALRSRMLVDNVCEILVLADRHTADELKSRAIDFVKAKATAVMVSCGWKNFISTHPQLVAEAFSPLDSQQSSPHSPPCKRQKQS